MTMWKSQIMSLALGLKKASHHQLTLSVMMMLTTFVGLLVTPVQPHLQCCLSQCLGSCQGSTCCGDEADIVPTPVLGPMPISAREFVVETPSHRVARVDHISGFYQEVIDFRLTLDETEINECSWQRALEKWYIVFARGREAWPKGHDIDDIIANRGVGGLRPIFGTRSHNTVVKRANSVIRYTHWFVKNRFSVNPFPISNTDLEDYLEALQFEGASPSAANSFIEAIRFCDKVLNIQGLSDTISPKALNLSELANSNRREKRQARTLTVQEVKSLESFMADEKNVMIDRFACGCFLFPLFSRSRWSDLRCVYGFASDIIEIDGKIARYLEYKTRSHKTGKTGSETRALHAPCGTSLGCWQHTLGHRICQSSQVGQ